MPFSGFVVWQGTTNMTLIGITIIGALGNLLMSHYSIFCWFKGWKAIIREIW